MFAVLLISAVAAWIVVFSIYEDSGWELVRGTITLGADGLGTAACPEGKFAVNGGVRHTTGSGKERLTSTPGLASAGEGWEVGGDPLKIVDVWVICVAA